jgi:D-cysteine desulfhydrase
MSADLSERFPLAALPTPLVRARGLSELTAAEIWVKRDDLTGFAFAGNKARPLELLIADALRSHHDEVIAPGGPTSSFCQGLAAACHLAGVPCTLVLYGCEPVTAPLSLKAMRRFGAQVVFTGEPDRSTTTGHAAALADDRCRQGGHPYVLPRGGATPLGAAAYVLAADELALQLSAAGIRAGRIVLAVGSGATIAGLLAGGLSLSVVGAVVSRSVEETRTNVLGLAADAAALLGRRAPCPEQLELLDVRDGRFGAATESTTAAVETALRSEAFVLEHTYTARALATLLDVVEPGDTPTIWWHTGGTLGAITDLLLAS